MLSSLPPGLHPASDLLVKLGHLSCVFPLLADSIVLLSQEAERAQPAYRHLTALSILQRLAKTTAPLRSLGERGSPQGKWAGWRIYSSFLT